MANNNDTRLLEKIVLIVITIAVPTITGFQWQTYQDQQKVFSEQQRILNAIESHDVRITNTEIQIAEIKGSMVTWDTLKRIELYLSSMDTKMANDALINALKAENNSRTKK